MITTIQKWGNSQGVRIPKSLLDAVRWSGNEQLSLSVQDDKIIIEKATPRKNIKELFAGYTGEYEPIDIYWGKSEGAEIW